MNMTPNRHKFAADRPDTLREAALQARAEVLAALFRDAGGALRRAQRWLARPFRPAPGRNHGESFYRCPECA